MLGNREKLKEERILKKAARTVEYNEEGKAIINMVINDDASFLSPFSSNEQYMITSDVADFIRINAEGINPFSELCLNIRSNCITEDNKPVYAKAIRNYFSAQAVENERALARCIALATVLGIVGFAILSAKITIDVMFNNVIWTSVMDCFSCVFLWEAINQLFIERYKLRINRMRLQGLSDMEVRFCSL